MRRFFLFSVLGVFGFFSGLYLSPKASPPSDSLSSGQSAQGELRVAPEPVALKVRASGRNAEPSPGSTSFTREQTAAANDLLMDGRGEALFTWLFSPQFAGSWERELPGISRRLQARWPAPSATGDPARGEALARMGILKALGEVRVSAEGARKMKIFLLSYLAGATPRPWAVEREALRALLRPEITLSEAEREALVPRVDPRSRALASENTEELLRKMIEGGSQ